jgi:hypothetical protein
LILQNDNHSDRWWAVALSDTLASGKLLPVMIDGDEYVVFRDMKNIVRALVDQCAHRRAPLSLGKVTASGWVECPYHGWRYDGQTGACVAVPNLSKEERVPKAYRVAAFDVMECEGFIFLHTGEQGRGRETTGLPTQPAGRSSGAHLISYPRPQLIDLLLDSPSAVLDIPGVVVVDNHWYGEPVIRNGRLVLDYAAQWADQVSDMAVADYPLLVRVSLDLQRESAAIELRSDADDLLASSWLEATPVKPALSAVFWRGSHAPGTARPISIGIKQQIDPQIVRTSPGNASKMRRLGMLPVVAEMPENASARAAG